MARSAKHTIPQAKFIALFDELALLLEANVELLEALRLLQSTTNDRSCRHLIEGLILGVAKGQSLGGTIRSLGVSLDPSVACLIEAGEASGTLPLVIRDMVHDQKAQLQLRQNLMQAITYPSIVLVVAVLVSLVLLFWVVPQFQALFNGFGAPLPMPTKVVIAIADWMRMHGPRVFVGVMVAIVFVGYHHRKQSFLWIEIEHAINKLPMVGDLLSLRRSANSTRLLSTLIHAQISLSQALHLAAAASSNHSHRLALLGIQNAIEQGTSFAQALEASQAFDPLVVHLAYVGERSGQVGPLLAQAAKASEQKVNIGVQRLSTGLEPFMMTVVGLLVGGLLVSLYLPIFTMSTVMM